MTDRKIIKQLPSYLQSEQLKKFFDATVDHWFQPESSRKVAGFVGRIPSYNEPKTDFYVNELTSERQMYQLESAMISVNDADELLTATTYPDLINHLRFQGANVDNHSRLFAQEYYSWAPPINIDMYLNFSNYYWYPEGPTSIELRGNSVNIINVDNVIGLKSYTSPNGIPLVNGMRVTFGTDVTPSSYTSGIWVVEGVGTGIIFIDFDLQDTTETPIEYTDTSKDYITIDRGAATENPWSRTNHWYHRDTITFQFDIDDIDDETAVLWDADAWDSKAWDIILSSISSDINLDTKQQAKRPILCFDRNLELYNYSNLDTHNVKYLDREHNDIFSQIQGQAVGSVTVDGKTLIAGDTILSITDLNETVNNRVYTIESVEISAAVFQYKLTLTAPTSTTSADPVLGRKILFLAGDEWAGKECHYDGTGYVTSQQKLKINQAPLFNLYDNDSVYLADDIIYPDSSFIGNTIFEYKEDKSASATIDKELKFGVFYKNFSQISEIVFENTIAVDVYSYETEPLVRKVISQYHYYKLNAANGIKESFSNTWHLSDVESSQNQTFGFYNIPSNLQANPDNDVVSEVSRSDLLKHFSSIVSNQDDFNGTVTNSNYSNSSRLLNKGTEILQHKAPLLKTMMLTDEKIDLLLSLRYSQTEYRRFYNKFLKRLEDFRLKGYTSAINSSVWFEDTISILNVSKKSSMFAFSNTRMAPHDKNYSVLTYAANINDETFIAPGTYNPSDITDSGSILVYKDNILLAIGYDYDITGTTIKLTSKLTATASIEIRYYENIERSFIPATPSAMGIAPVYKPQIITDTTYVLPTKMIQGHDGSLTLAFNDERDAVIIELEMRIYNSIRAKFREDKDVVFDTNKNRPGKFRTNNYAVAEYNHLLSPAFTTWATKSNVNWVDNTTYVPSEWKTWNWTGTNDSLDGEQLHGNFRSVYVYYYDTDRPHSHPWEMLGFSEEPTWWVSEYGAAPYTSTNKLMWEDLTVGMIRQGPRSGINKIYIRERLMSLIPVNQNGVLLDPVSIGIAAQNPKGETASGSWQVGDRSPVENAMWRSVEGKFVESQILYLMAPVEFVELNWDTEGLSHAASDKTQILNTRFGFRPRAASLTVTTEEVNIQGIQQWIEDYLQSTNLPVSENLGSLVRGLGVSLAWKTGTFVKANTIRFLADSFSPGSTANLQKVFIQDDDIKIELYKSASVNEPSYSGVLIEWTGTGYSVVGYDSVYPFFRTIPNETGKTIPVTVGDVTVLESKIGSDRMVEVPYGYEFKSRQEIYDFLTEYGRWLEQDGWVFDQFDNSSNEILNWRNSGKEYIFWSLDDLQPGAFITLSPLAHAIKYKQSIGFVENVKEITRGAFSMLDRQGFAISPNDLNTIRDENEISVLPTNDQGIYAARLSIATYEQIILINNITRFNDTIYIPLYNLRQERLKVFGTVIDGWNGRIETPGYVLDLTSAKDLVPNFEKTTSDFLKYHDIENPSENETITDVARHLIGYQRREYLDQLLVDRDVQYEFYQGMIHQKGSRNSLNKLFRSTAITSSDEVQFFEEWAFRIGQYGGLEISPPLELFLSSNNVKTNPQLIRFNNGDTPDITTDNIVDVTPNDSNWILKSSSAEPKFDLREKNKFFKKDLPNAGFAQLGESDHLVAKSSMLFDSTHSSFDAEVNDIIWVAKFEDPLPLKTWDIYQLNTASNNVWYTSDFDDSVLMSYMRNTYIGDAATLVFTSFSTISLDQATTRITVNGNAMGNDEYNVVGTNAISFIDPPALGSIIILDAISSNTWFELDTIAYFTEPNSKTAGIITAVGDSSITLDTSINIEIVSGAEMTYLRSKRYANSIGLIAADFEDQILYMDSDTSNNGWVVIRSDGRLFKELRREEQLIDTQHLKNALIYNDQTNKILANMTVYDPFKGYIPGVADVEITFKLEYDPAKYTHNLEADVFDQDLAWGDTQIGQVWWDTNASTYLWYEQGSIEYRYQNWGKLFPGSEIKVYEWVRSPVNPTEWVNYIETSVDVFNFSPDGTVKDIDTINGPKWVERNGIDERTRAVKTYYYFWVENSNSSPNLDTRSIPLTEIATLLFNPFSYGLKYCAALREDLFIAANIISSLDESESALQINFKNDDSDVPVHKQWELLREGDKFSEIKDIHWNKMRDSLVGFDAAGKEIPDNRLRGKSRFGSFIRPRQTWFEDRILARRIFVDAVNAILLDIDVLANISKYDKSLNTEAILDITESSVKGTVANPSVNVGDQININGTIIVFSGLQGSQGIADEINNAMSMTTTFAELTYSGTDIFMNIKDSFGTNINIIDVVGTPTILMGLQSGVTTGEGPDHIVPTRADRDALTALSIGDKIYIENDESVSGYWTFWEYNGSDFILLQVQSYRTNLYWDFTDWYATGYDENTLIVNNYATLAIRNLAKNDDGTIVTVENDGSGKWLKSIMVDGQWVTIGKEDATIQFKDTLYNPLSGAYGFSDDLFDTKRFDDIPNTEFKEIMNALRNDIFVDSYNLHQNILFFKMVRHVHTEQELVDWCFKTSYIYLIGFSETLEAKPLFQYDGFESLIDYIKEVKPYHTKIKDVIRTFASTADEATWSIMDFDKPAYVNEDGTTKVLDPNDVQDLIILERDYSEWLSEYKLDNRPTVARANNVRKLKTRLAFDRTSAIRDDYSGNYEKSPFFKAVSEVNSTNTRDNPSWLLLNAYDGTATEEFTNRIPATVRDKLINNIVTLEVTGTWTSSVINIVGTNPKDSTTKTRISISSPGTYTFDYINDDYINHLADITGFTGGDTITIKMSVSYDNSLSRALRYYKPDSQMMQLLEVVTSEYDGVVIDGANTSVAQGFDSIGYDVVAFDSGLSSLESSENVLSGGAFETYIGDGTTAVFDLPTNNVENSTWRVYASDISINPRVPIVLDNGIHYIIDDVAGTLTMQDLGSDWNSPGAFLATNWVIVLVDSSYTSTETQNIIIDGYHFTQPEVEGWPEELSPLKINDSMQMTVQTTGNIIQDMLVKTTGTLPNILGNTITFAGSSPLIFAIGGIVAGDVIKLTGSTTEDFTVSNDIFSFTTNTSITVPDIINGYVEYEFYRMVITAQAGGGTLTATASGDLAPGVNKSSAVGTGSQLIFEINNDVQQTDDILVSINGSIVASNRYTVNTATDTITFGVAPLLNDIIQITSFNTSGVTNTDPRRSTFAFLGATFNMTTMTGGSGIPSPTQPLEGSILNFVDPGTTGVYHRLDPPEMSYYTADGQQDTFVPVSNRNGSIAANVSVYVNDILQTLTTDYTFVVGAGNDDDKVVFVTAPTVNFAVAFKTTGNEEFLIAGNNMQITSGAITGDAIDVYSFQADDSPLGIQTVSWPGHANADINGQFGYTLYGRPPGSDFVFITVDGLELSENDFDIEVGSGWDQESWDNSLHGIDGGPGSVIKLNTSYTVANQVVITTYSGNPTFSTVAYREFQGWDIVANDFNEFIRFSDNNLTTLAADLLVTDVEITVVDGSSLPVTGGGVVWIDYERIEFGFRAGNVLSEIVRGSKGTRKNKLHLSGQKVRAGDGSQIVSNMQNNLANTSGIRLQASKNERATFINREPGTYF